MAGASSRFKGEGGARVSVLLPLPLNRAFDYRDPGFGPGPGLAPGDYVTVNFGGRTVTGVVWDSAPDASLPENRLKPVVERLDLPPCPAVSRRFVEWVARYTVSDLGAVLKMVMPVREAFKAPPSRQLYSPTGLKPARLTPARQAVLDALAETGPQSVADIAARAGVSDAVVRGLVDAGALEAMEVAADRSYPAPDANRVGPVLSPDQAAAAAAIKAARGFTPILLEGVTGSGKTEVYFEAIADVLQDPAAQVLVLLPEIALTSQWLDRFSARFGVAPVLWHSDLGAAERRRAWRAIAKGEARVVVGARSALFLPYPALRLIIVDEEHDPGFKQEEGVIYQGRDMAVVRAQLDAIPIVMASATPSLETVYNVQRGRYQFCHLPDRHGAAELPDIHAVDMRQNPPPRGRFLSPPLRDAILRTAAAGEQVLLFLNRRGYAPLTLCRACGHRLECPQCAAWLVEHRPRPDAPGRLQCHHCGHQTAVPDACPACDAEDSLVACGPGVERIAEEVAELAPDLRALVLSSDLMATPARFAELIAQITDHRVDCIIGTQIVTKGYHFPKLTLVGVVDADLGLSGGDLRAAERTYQQLSQVAGRAGREERPGRVLLQTYLPEHPVMTALIRGDKDAFVKAELQARADQGLPPFGRLAALIISGEDNAAVTAHARRLGVMTPKMPGVTVLGPVPAPFALLRGRHRWRMLIKVPREVDLSRLLREWLTRVGETRGIRVQVDIDPYSFL